MSDGCYINITILKKDQAAFGKIFGGEPEEWYEEVDSENDRYISVTSYEANYAWYGELDAAADGGMVFFGQHAAGGNYGAGAFVGIDEMCRYASVDETGHVVVRVSRDGEIDGDEYFGAMDYYKELDRAVEIILGKKSDP